VGRPPSTSSQLEGGIHRYEEYIGCCISQRRREYYLATKCGCTIVKGRAHDKTPHRWTRDCLLHNLDSSLRRLQTDYVDVWQLHNP
jgi:aryl-alcohol dehydrogenase-like predicted oxidoreductase